MCNGEIRVQGGRVGTKNGTLTSNDGNDGGNCLGIDSTPTYAMDNTTMTTI